MPSHGTDVLKLFPDTRVDKFGLAGSDIVKMTSREIRTAAKSAGLPFTKIEPIVEGLVFTGFLETKEDDGKKYYFKSPLLRSPASKIDWSELLTQTKEFVDKHWSECAEEYKSRYCEDVEVVEPFTGETIKIAHDAASPADMDVVGGDFPEVFKTKADYEWTQQNEWNEVEFLITAQGDYKAADIELIKEYINGL